MLRSWIRLRLSGITVVTCLRIPQILLGKVLRFSTQDTPSLARSHGRRCRSLACAQARASVQLQIFILRSRSLPRCRGLWQDRDCRRSWGERQDSERLGADLRRLPRSDEPREGTGICVVAAGWTQVPVHADVEFKRLGAADAQPVPQTLPRPRSGQGQDTGGERECRATPHGNGTQAISHR